MLSLSDIRLGTVLTIDGNPYQVVSTQHVKVARGGATLRTKMKNLITGATLEKSFSGADKVEAADLSHNSTNYLYQQEDRLFFMDNENFEQYEFPVADLGDMPKYLKDGETVDVLLHNSKAVSVQLPKKVTLTVVSAPPGVRGDTSGGATKTVVMETGLELRVPLFIKEGEKLTINTETGDYVERAG